MDLALDVAGLAELLTFPPFEQLRGGDVEGVLDGFGRFAAEVIAPADRPADRIGVDFDASTGAVAVPSVLREVFERWAAGGWSGLTVAVEEGGGGLPSLVGVAVEEMFASANLALSLCSMLTQGAVHLLLRWGSPRQRALYLPHLVAGEWTGTMCLTEPDAGSDLSAVRTRATPRADGRWELTGTKIFITWGEHDLTGNIVHLVLARTPGSPPGVQGISLFVVPRNLVDEDGNVGERNGVRCTGVEEKLGLHASPTCVIELDAAVGELVGPERCGLQAMFTMMNAARLSVGVEGLAVAERAYQQAVAHARDRIQGRRPGTREAVPILEHPDVARMLASMESGIDAMRLLLYHTAATTDRARYHPDPGERELAGAQADLLTPLAKAWCTDEGVRIASLALQVHGGMGYVEETGVAQRYRDSRVMPIYEGTNGIQAIDLVGRKVLRDRGAAITLLFEALEPHVAELRHRPGMGRVSDLLRDAMAASGEATRWVLEVQEEREWLAGATPFLELAALAIVGGLLARQLARAGQSVTPRELSRIEDRVALFSLERSAHAPALLETVTTGSSQLLRAMDRAR